MQIDKTKAEMGIGVGVTLYVFAYFGLYPTILPIIGTIIIWVSTYFYGIETYKERMAAKSLADKVLAVVEEADKNKD